MIKENIRNELIERAEKYNNLKYFLNDPIAFPRKFLDDGAPLQDIEIAAVFASHLAWGRRQMIMRDCERLFDEMQWRPFEYVMSGDWRNDDTSLHRTIKWSETAEICRRLRDFYHGSKKETPSLEKLSAQEVRTGIFGRREDPRAADKKINMMRRWLVRRDGKVDLGIWGKTRPADLLIPLDVHVYTQAADLGLTSRRQKDIYTAKEITGALAEVFPGDPVKGDFALFGYGVSNA